MAYVMVHYWSLLQHNKKWKLRKNNCDPPKKVPSKSSLGLAQVHEVMMRKMRGEEAILALGGTQKQERERIEKGRDQMFHTIV